MPRTVGHVGYQLLARSLRIAEQPVHRPDDDLYQVDVLPFVEPADIVGIGNPAVMENDVDGTCMVLDIEPVPDVFSTTVYGQRLAVTDVVDEKRNQLFRKLVRPVIVRTVGHDGRQSVRIVEGPHEMVARRLARTVRAVRVVLGRFIKEFPAIGQMMFARRCRRRKRRFDTFGMRHLQRPVHLVRGNMVKPLALVIAVPILFGRL